MTRVASGGHCGSIRKPGTTLHHGLTRKKCKTALAMRQSSSYPGQFCCPTFIQVTQPHIREVSPPHLFGSRFGGKHNLTPLPLHGSGVPQPQGEKTCHRKCDTQPSLLLCGEVFPIWRSTRGHFYFISDADQNKSIGEVWLSMGPQGVFPHMKIFLQGHKQGSWWMDSFVLFFFLLLFSVQ